MKNVAMNSMLKMLSMTALMVPLTAFAGTKDSGAGEYFPKTSVKCIMPGAQDATFSLWIRDFEVKGKTPIAMVAVPRGETEVDRYETPCSYTGRVEVAINCELTTPDGLQFRIRVASPGDSSLNGMITPVAENGDGETIYLSCKRGFHNPLK